VTRNGVSATYNYDANGNMIKNRDKEILYDVENRPRRINVIDSALPPVSFTYDYQGQRVKKRVGTTNITTYVSSLYEYKEISGISAPIYTMHIFAGGRRVASKTGTEGWVYQHSDHLGSLRVATGPAGNIRQTDEYDPFGKTAKETSTASISPYKFTGQEEDAETGLYYYGARYYDPALGRFISADTIVQAPGDPQTLNRYSYCRNNPVLFTDPSGHIFGIDDAFFFGMIAAGALLGATTSAITGQDIGTGALTGAISAAFFMGAHAIIAAKGLTGIVAASVHVSAGTSSGAINAAITGGDPLMGAVTSGVSAGVAYGVGSDLEFPPVLG
jgi:RHS repeat-associated protein